MMSLTFGLFYQVSASGPHGPLVSFFFFFRFLFFFLVGDGGWWGAVIISSPYRRCENMMF